MCRLAHGDSVSVPQWIMGIPAQPGRLQQLTATAAQAKLGHFGTREPLA
jgi:hypothetical protein